MTTREWEPEIESALESSGWIGSYAGVLPGGTEVFVAYPPNDRKQLTTVNLKYVCFPGTLDPRPRELVRP